MTASPADLDRKLFAALDRLGRALRAARQRLATDLSLSSLQVEIVDLLGRRGPLPVGQIAGDLDIAQPTASDAVAALDRKGLVGRRRSPDDGRVTVASLTSAGADTASTIATELGRLHPPREPRRHFQRGLALEVLLEEMLRLQRAGVISVNRSCLSCHHHEAATADGPARCHLLDTDLHPADLRVDCAEHQPAA